MGPGQRKHFDKLSRPQLLKLHLDSIIESQFLPAAADLGARLYEYSTFLVFQAVFLLHRSGNAFEDKVCTGRDADRRDSIRTAFNAWKAACDSLPEAAVGNFLFMAPHIFGGSQPTRTAGEPVNDQLFAFGREPARYRGK